MSNVTYYEFILTDSYAAAAKGIVDDVLQRTIEQAILRNPMGGDVIPGAGVRKIRVAVSGKGKRGGARVIYFVMLEKGRIYLLDVYTKNVKTNITEDEKKELAKLRKVLKGE
ncbi:MAG: type II toxin-antitoxin system RelE/ParE family toxin [Gemmatimonadaceae bacterium]